MWLTSNSPTPVRTAMCSAMRPEYSTGISQPPKSTILAPRRRWVALRAVLRSAAGAAVDTVQESFGRGGELSRVAPAERICCVVWLSSLLGLVRLNVQLQQKGA